MTTGRSVTDAERRRRLATQHLLVSHARVDAIEDVAKSVVALHSSDPATVYLACAARARQPSVAAVDRSLYSDRSLVRHHAMRRTLWVSPAEDAASAHSSTNPRIAAAERRRLVSILDANGVAKDPGAWIDDAADRLRDALAQRGTATTRDLGEALPDLAVPLSLQQVTLTAHARVLLLMGFEGSVVRTHPIGSWISSQYRWSIADDWIPGVFDPVDHREAAARLASAYVSRFGPVTTSDVAWWTGWTMATVRRALEDADAHEVDIDGGIGWMACDDEATVEAEPWVAMLPGLDPTPMGWKNRDWYLDPAIASLVFDRNGNAGPTVWMDGRIVGGWAQLPDGDIAYRLLDATAEERRSEFDEAAARMQQFYGEARHKVRFPSPIQRELIGDRGR